MIRSLLLILYAFYLVDGFQNSLIVQHYNDRHALEVKSSSKWSGLVDCNSDLDLESPAVTKTSPAPHIAIPGGGKYSIYPKSTEFVNGFL